MVKVRKDLTGMKFGRLTVVEQSEDYIAPCGRHYPMWKCICSCIEHNIVFVTSQDLKSGHTKSCGCFNRDQVSARSKKYNQYDLLNEYGVGILSNTGKEFYFDLEDYDLIKNYYWMSNNYGYVYAHNNDTTVSMHRLVINCPSDMVVDHINGNKLDNRKSNLRVCTIAENVRHRVSSSNNDSGNLGVFFDKRINKWCSKLFYNGKNYYLGSFETKEQAIDARRHAEIKYFGEFAPHESLYEQHTTLDTIK